MVVVLFAPGDIFEGYVILRVLPAEGEIQRYQVTTPGGERGILYCRIKRRASDEEVADFRQRVSVLQALNHKHIPGVLQAGYAKGTFFWMAGGFPKGTSLRALLDETPNALELANILVLANQVADTFDAAHERTIAHFGLTPAHIYVDPETLELSSILSLGLRITMDASPSHQRGEVIYRAPEQVRRESADHRADMHAFGMILYELIAGEPPYLDQLREMGVPSIAASSDLLLDSMPVANPTRLCKRIPGLEPMIERLVFVMINKRPDDRPATWRDVHSGVTTAGKCFAMGLALQGPEQREELRGMLVEPGTLTLDELMVACAVRPGEAAAPFPSAETSSTAGELASSSPLPKEDAPAAELASSTAPPKEDAPAAELALSTAPPKEDAPAASPVQADEGAPLHKPQANEPSPDRERPSASPRTARSPWLNRLAPGLLFITGMAVATSGLLWFLHPVRSGPAPAPVIVQVLPAPSVREPAPAPLYLVPLPLGERAQRMPLFQPPAPPPTAEPAPPPPAPEEKQPPERDRRPLKAWESRF